MYNKQGDKSDVQMKESDERIKERDERRRCKAEVPEDREEVKAAKIGFDQTAG